MPHAARSPRGPAVRVGAGAQKAQEHSAFEAIRAEALIAR